MLIKDLPQPIKQMALDNMKVPDENRDLQDAFRWDKTEQGDNFWRSLSFMPNYIKIITNHYTNDQQLGEVVRKLANV